MSLTSLTDTSKISSACGASPIEYLLDAAGRPQTAGTAIKSPLKQVGKKKGIKGSGRDLSPRTRL